MEKTKKLKYLGMVKKILDTQADSLTRENAYYRMVNGEFFVYK